MSLGKWLLFGAALFAGWHGYRSSQRVSAGDMDEEGLRTLAADVKPQDVVIYTTSTCPYCAQAMHWMDMYGFEYTECNAQTDARCEREFRDLGADGVPYLIVRDHHMENGFDTDEFIRALQKE